jgi:hypothetical protein
MLVRHGAMRALDMYLFQINMPKSILFLMQDGYQNRYFVLKSFKDGAQKLRDYCSDITPPDIMARFLNKVTPALTDDPQIRAGQM